MKGSVFTSSHHDWILTMRGTLCASTRWPAPYLPPQHRPPPPHPTRAQSLTLVCPPHWATHLASWLWIMFLIPAVYMCGKGVHLSQSTEAYSVHHCSGFCSLSQQSVQVESGCIRLVRYTTQDWVILVAQHHMGWNSAVVSEYSEKWKFHGHTEESINRLTLVSNGKLYYATRKVEVMLQWSKSLTLVCTR